MNILVWNCPWGSQGNSFFFKNCLKETLVPQANLLVEKNNKVYTAYIDYLEEAVLNLKDQVHKIKIEYDRLTNITGFGRVLEEIYAEPSGELVDKLVGFFKNILPKDIDVIITWENPIPYLEEIYPNALIVNQMPGSFSRLPYPNTITFDPVGLYNRSVLAKADNVFNVKLSDNELELGNNFIKYIKKNIIEIQPYTRKDITNDVNNLVLLPLQVSAHYAFYSDSQFSSQIGILEQVLNCSDNKDAYLVTQYKSSFTADKPINSKTYSEYVDRWPNLIWNEKYDALPFQSQLLLPCVDKVCAYTSSIIFQAMAWGKPISILNGSYYKKYETNNENDIERNKKVVSFLINRYQPLASYITKNASFLDNLLREMLHRKQKGKEGIDLCVPFHEIDSEYSSSVLNEFTNNTLLKDVAQIQPQVNNQYQFLKKFRGLVESSAISHVSFDVFDTLLERPFENPSGLFHVIAQEIWKTHKIQLDDFYRIRIWAEQKARRETDAEEITLNDIYLDIQNYYNLTSDQTRLILDTEIDLELRFIKPRALGQRLWKIAQQSNKTIVIISDMYLPQTIIEEMLEKNKYTQYDKIYVSSTEKITKYSGNMFDHAITTLDIIPSSMLHVGDNKRTDISSAEKYKISTFYIPKGATRLHINRYWNDIFSERQRGEYSREILLGLISRRCFSDIPIIHESRSLFGGDPWRLGYSALGSLYTGFVQWLHKKAISDEIECLYFLSREGYILKEVFNILYPDSNIKTKYLYCSRRAVSVAALKTQSDVRALAYLPFVNGVSLNELLENRFGIQLNDIPQNIYPHELVKGINISSLSSNLDGRIWFAQFCSQISDYILEATKHERSAYTAYLDQEGLLDSQNIAIVDIGWRGNMQTRLASFTSQPIKGYYFATSSGYEYNQLLSGKMSSYVGNSFGSWSNNILFNNRKMFELLTCHSDKSLKCMSIIGSNIVPVFIEEENYNIRAEFIKTIHSGVKTFAKDYFYTYASIDNEVFINAELSSKVLSSFLNNPQLEDILIFKHIAFEDAFAGVQSIQLSKQLKDVWPAAANVLKHQESKKNKRLAKPASVPDDNHINSNKDGRWLLKIEEWVLKRFLNDRKYNKYLRSRESFWMESKSKLAHSWFKISQYVLV